MRDIGVDYAYIGPEVDFDLGSLAFRWILNTRIFSLPHSFPKSGKPLLTSGQRVERGLDQSYHYVMIGMWILDWSLLARKTARLY